MKHRYQTPMGPLWFLRRAGYRRFMAREMTAFALAVILHGLIFGAALYHSFTWFNLTPKIMPLYVAEEKVPDLWAAIVMGYLPWVVVTAVVLWGVAM